MRKNLFFTVFIICLSITIEAQVKSSLIVGGSWRNIRLTNMPLSVRDVPAHQDDGQTTSPIERTKYSLGFYPLELGLRLQLGQYEGIKYGGQIFIAMSGYDLAERNYTNTAGTPGRGVGVALTFCGLTTMGPISLITKNSILGISVIPYAFAEKKLTKKSQVNLYLGYESLAAVNGWDRYDELELREIRILAHLIPIRIGWQSSLSNLGFEIGPQFMLPIKTALGQEAGMRASIGAYINMKILN